MVKQYNYTALGGLVNINTLSPNKEYYYQVSKPKSLNPAAWGVKIAFFNLKQGLLYHKKDKFANEVPSKDIKHSAEKGMFQLPKEQGLETIEFVRWSADGNMAYIFEYSIPSNYSHKFIDLREKKVYSLKYSRENDFFVPPGFSIDCFNEILSKYNISSESAINDKPTKNFLFDKWYPNI